MSFKNFIKSFLVSVLIFTSLFLTITIREKNMYREYTEVETYVIKGGDTLSGIAMGIATKSQIDVRGILAEMYKLNADLTPNIQVGQEVILPVYK